MHTTTHNLNATRQGLGARVRLLRELRGLTQQQLADVTRIDRTYLSSVENGRRNVSLDNLARIAGGLGVSLSVLMEGVGESVG